VDVPAYDFTTHKRTGIERTITKPSVVFLDGIFTIACPEIRCVWEGPLFPLP
jgi:uridine kinase